MRLHRFVLPVCTAVLGCPTMGLSVASALSGPASIASRSDEVLLQPEQPQPDPTLKCAMQLRNLTAAIYAYSAKHGGKLPADLYSLALAGAEPGGEAGGAARAGANGLSRDAATRSLVSPAHQEAMNVPKDVTPEWVNGNSSYRYLANGEVSLDGIQDWSSVVVAHLRLDAGHVSEVGPDNLEGRTFTLAYADGHVEILPGGEAERRIAHSQAIFDAMRSGKDMPDDHQAMQDLGLIVKALRGYAEAHEGKLPATLGAALPHVPADPKSRATLAQRARIFLSPKAKRSTAIPDEPTPEWIDAHGSYVYLGSDRVVLREVPEPQSIMLVCGRPGEGYNHAAMNGVDIERFPLVTVNGLAVLRTKPAADWIVAESRKTFAAIAPEPGAPKTNLPPWVEASRDLRVLGESIMECARKNGAQLAAHPADAVSCITPNLKAPLLAPPASIAGLFLSPRAEAATELPGAPSLDWIRSHANYVYFENVAPGVLTIDQLREAQVRFMLHGPMDEPYAIMSSEGKPIDCVPVVDVFGGCHMAPREWIEEELAADRGKIKALMEAAKPVKDEGK